MKINIFILFLIFWFNVALAQEKTYTYSDGPYITEVDNSLEIQWVEKGILKDSTVLKSEASWFSKPGLPIVNLNDLSFKPDESTSFEGVKEFVAISDIHGQYDLFIELLKSHKVIDQENKWNFGKGHLVIVGDVFDRGDKVTETLWFLFNLEKEALSSGGKVHLLLGNHEVMVMHDDVGYIHKKYRYTSGISQKPYFKFFSKKTILGHWLRSKNICVSINDVAFVHGGFSKKVIDKENDLSKINRFFKDEILSNNNIMKGDPGLLPLLYFENGPLWYRGYANPDGFDEEKAIYILEKLGKKTIVIGHTSMPRIVSNYQNKIILIDSSIKFGKTGEILYYNEGEFFRGLLDGSKINLENKPKKDGIKTAFQYVYDLGDQNLRIDLILDYGLLIKNKLSDDYLPGKMIAIHNEEKNREWEVKIATRGNTRRQVCNIPPLKIDLQKPNLKILGFAKNDKLKIVLPCDKSKSFVENTMKEHLIYQMYQLIDSLSFRTRIIKVGIINAKDNKIKYDLDALMIEDVDDITFRSGAAEIKEGFTGIDALDRESYLKLVFFQYLILNCDWSLGTRHNMKLIKLEGADKLRALPYDFDYAGLVGQNYAVPPAKFPIESVLTPYFMGFHVKQSEIELMLTYFNNIEKELIETIENSAYYLSEKSRNKFKKRLESFYKTLRNKKGWKRNFMHR